MHWAQMRVVKMILVVETVMLEEGGYASHYCLLELQSAPLVKCSYW